MKLTISNSLIIISIIFTLISFQNEEIMYLWMNSDFLIQQNYIKFLFQICFYSFIHGSIMHLVFNSLFLYIFWNQVEQSIGNKLYILFFILTTLFNTIFILIFSTWTTIWISGFGMALLSFYTYNLYNKNDSEYKWWITAIIINILLWFSSTISLTWHLFWALFWCLYYFILKTIKKSL